jgi:hypothetical protein
MTDEIYRRRVDHFSAVRKRYVGRERMATRLRVATFLAAVAFFVLGRNSPAGAAWYGTAWYIAGGAAVAGFIAAVLYHDYVRRQIERNGLFLRINEQAIARLMRDWAALPDPKVSIPPEHQAVADDLDLFGHASLFQMLCAANTPHGLATLRDWLLEGAMAEEIPLRQAAVAELAPQLELRQTLDLEGRLLAGRGRSAAGFLEWAEGLPWLAARPWLTWVLRAMSLMVPLLIGLCAMQVLSLERGVIVILAAVVLNLIASAFLGWRVNSVFSQINTRYNETAQYISTFRLMYAMPHGSAELSAIKQQATELGGGVLRCLGRLQRIVFLARIRHSPMLFIFVYLPLQIVLLYDFHILSLLEAWQRQFGRHARTWFEALGKLEALSSLAVLSHDYPAWAMPTVDGSADRFQARELGHPLLPDGSRVANDVELGPRGTFLLVTGSNMSGKSTLLRSIGLGAVMARAGAPVCAAQLRMPPLALATSMRVRDSLESGVSFYMAELLRLKQIVDLARKTEARDAQARGGRLLLYLLDEILMGTNSKERHIAVVRVMEHLLRHNTIGAVSTHDLDLATSPPLAAACCCVHLREMLHDEHAADIMTFDYRLRPGVATTSNALKLLEIVGLGEEKQP